MAKRITIDGHVHLYARADWGLVLQAGLENLSRLDPEAQPCLLLTETARDDAFTALARGQRVPPGWEVQTFPEDRAALLLKTGARRKIIVFAGFQVITQERLEILVPASEIRPPDGLPIRSVLADLTARNQPAILPWGVGKWSGYRGQIMRDLVQAGAAKLLGDNAGRPSLWPDPGLFDHCPVLPGSDPLPIPGQEGNVGRFGFVLDGELSHTKPAQDLRVRLMALTMTPRPIGQRLGPTRVLRDQIALRTSARFG